MSLLMSSFANTGIMPQLVADLKPEYKQRGAILCPMIAVSMQLTVLMILGLCGYAALGSAVEFDTFRAYQEYYPDGLTSLLQCFFGFLILLAYPMMILPCAVALRSRAR